MRLTYLLLSCAGRGGTIRSVLTQCGAMAAAGHDVELIAAIRKSAQPGFPLPDGVRLRYLVDWRNRTDRGRVGTEIPAGETRGGEYTEEVVGAIRAALGALDTDVLLTTRPGLDLLAARHTRPGVLRIAQVHASFSQVREPLRDAIIAEYPHLDAVVTLTEADRRAYRAFLDVPVAAIPNALHTLDVPDRDPDATMVVAAGRLERIKGFDLLIKAFAPVAEEHPDWTLRIFGAGTKQPQLRKLIFKRHLYNHVHLMGHTRNLSAEYAKASVFAFSSRHEGFGLALAEAMSHGLVPVSFDCPYGPGEIIAPGEDGLLVPNGDIEAMTDALRTVITDREKRVQMGDAARRNARRFGPSSQVEAWERILSEVPVTLGG
ncbi:hypothetical protein GCM10027589_37240 [Actinocorallia lasiicapitis]